MDLIGGDKGAVTDLVFQFCLPYLLPFPLLKMVVISGSDQLVMNHSYFANNTVISSMYFWSIF